MKLNWKSLVPSRFQDENNKINLTQNKLMEGINKLKETALKMKC